jgi:ABC-type uncharacterized transport system substrate-binding protein
MGRNLPPMWTQAATYVDRVLRGEKRADLPVQAPSTIEFVINLKTAKTPSIFPKHCWPPPMRRSNNSPHIAYGS